MSLTSRPQGARRFAVALLILFAAFVAAVVPVAAERPNGAGLVVRFEDGSLVYAYVQFDEESISSEELLLSSGLSVVVAPFGGLGSGICKIQDTGCPSDDCFCKSYSQPVYFWHFYGYNDSGWSEQLSGASTQSVSDGEIDGWSWTAGDSGLPATTIEEIATLNGVDLSDPTPTPTATATLVSTNTPQPTTPIQTPPPPNLSTPTSAIATSSPVTQPLATSQSTGLAVTNAATATPSPVPTAKASATAATALDNVTKTASETASSTASLAATLTATLGPTTVAVFVPPGGTPVPLKLSDSDRGSARDFAMFGALAALVVAGGVAVVYRNRKASR